MSRRGRALRRFYELPVRAKLLLAFREGAHHSPVNMSLDVEWQRAPRDRPSLLQLNRN